MTASVLEGPDGDFELAMRLSGSFRVT
jgi:hypothetical protein